MLGVAAKAAQEAGFDADPPSRPKRAAPRKGSIYDAAKGPSTVDVCGWLGLPVEERDGKTFTTCVGCGNTDSLICEPNGGTSCFHETCKKAGSNQKTRYRSNIDMVSERRRVATEEAAKLICLQFGISVPVVQQTVAPPDDDELDAFGPTPEPPPWMDEDVANLPPVEEPSVDEPLRLAAILEPALERAEKRRTGEERPVPVPFRDYGEVLAGGFWPGVHTQVASTGAGKSQFMFQCATYAARENVPVLYIGLELGAFQVACRTLGDAAGTAWSKLYTGRCTARDIERAREALPDLTGLPFFVEFGTAHGWAPSNLITRAEQIRKLHPTGPMLVVLDFLQLVGAEPVQFGGQPDLRERIGRASYAGVHVANTLGASVVLISSSARTNYGILGGDSKGAGLVTNELPGRTGPTRTILAPDVLMGLGKESGEIEYSAESQTVLMKWPAALENGERVVIAAIPKLRYGPPSWVPFRFWHRFDELPFQTLDELPEPPSKGSRGLVVASDEYEARVLATVRQFPGLRSKNDISSKTSGSKGTVNKAIDRLLAGGKLTLDATGFSVTGGANQ